MANRDINELHSVTVGICTACLSGNTTNEYVSGCMECNEELKPNLSYAEYGEEHARRMAKRAPQWSATPPSEPGIWWALSPHGKTPWLVDARFRSGRVLHGAVMWCSWHFTKVAPDPIALDDHEWADWLWWPVPITPPKAP
jgi:hypothetical protein